MTVEVLFTNGVGPDANEIGKHLVAGGVWVEQVEEDGMQKAYINCLDKTVMNDFVDPFGLTNIKIDVPLAIGDYFLAVFKIKVWGSKLDAILGWKDQMESLGSAVSIPHGEAKICRQGLGEGSSGVSPSRHKDFDGDVRPDHREGQERT